MVNVLDLIKDIGEIIAQNTEQQVVLQKIARHLATQIKTEVCSIYVYDESHDKLVMKATHGYPESAVNKIVLSPGEGITGSVFSSGKSINSNKPQKLTHYHYFPELHEENIHSILSVPLKVAEKTVGVLNLESVQEEKYSPETVGLVKRLSPQITNVLLDCLMFDELKVGNKKVDRPLDSRFTGQAVTKGLVVGSALLMDTDSLLNSISWQPVKDVESELKLFEESIEYAKKETIRLEQEASKVLTESDASIFYSHLLILEDKHLLDTVRDYIKEGNIAKFALKSTLVKLKKQFSQIESESIRERLADITDVILRIVHSVNYILQDKKNAKEDKCPLVAEQDKIIIIAHELYPSQLISWPLNKMAGIICETGGSTSHVAIIAKALKIPTLMGAKNATKLVKQREKLLLDCHAGNCYINPTDSLLEKFSAGINASQKLHEVIPPQDSYQETTDGTKVDLLANMSLVSELPMMEMYGANGIGLYRTEFLYMVRTSHPSMKDQLGVFTHFAEACKNDKPFTLRLLDVGGDKPVSFLNFAEETNPLLGLRGLRLLLKHERLLRTHIEAILRTTLIAPVKILIPMVSTLDELLAVIEVIDSVKAKVERRLGQKVDNYEVGIMVETPSILFELDKVMKYVDFLSIGSNDLIQYSFAVDRNNSVAIGGFKNLNPTIIRMLKHIVDTVKKYPGKTITLCGELAGNTKATPLLIGMGLNSLSMSPWIIPEVREVVKNVSSADCEKLVNEFIDSETVKHAEFLLESFLDKNSVEAEA